MKNTSKLFTNLFGIIAALAIIVYFFTACSDGGGGGDGSGGGSTGITVPKVGELPAFPAGSNPATASNVDSILSALAHTRVLDSVYETIEEVVYDDAHHDDNYRFPDQEDHDKTVKVSASKETNERMSKNFKDFYSYLNYDDDDDAHDHSGIYGIRFTTSDYDKISEKSWKKGKTTKDISQGSVVIVEGATIEEQDNFSGSLQVTIPGYINPPYLPPDASRPTVKANGNYSEKFQHASGYTVTTSEGSVKIILDLTIKASEDEKNADLFREGGGGAGYGEPELPNYPAPTVKYSGSLKVYGENNALLETVSVMINDYRTYAKALGTIGITLDAGYYFIREGGEGVHKSIIAPPLMKRASKL